MKGEETTELRLKPETRKFEANLEALRGAAALVVVWSHSIVFSPVLSPGYNVSGVWSSEPPARISVFLFFVLSGFVIGISNKQPLVGATIGPYLKKRFVRIYPIYFLAMVLTVLVAKPYPLGVIAANFTFLQVAFTTVIWENNPIWSLNYEVLYYLLFIPLSFFRVNYLVAALAAAGVGVANVWFFPSQPLLSSYSFGLATWLAGLAMARLAQKTADGQVRCQELVGMVLMLCTFRYFNVLDTVLLKLTRALVGSRLEYPGPRGYQAMANFSDFSYLPYFILFILLFTNKDFRFKALIKNTLFLLPATTFFYLFKNRAQLDLVPYVQPGCLYLLGLAFIYLPGASLEVVSQRVIGLLAKIGSVSYGLYIIHMPLLVMIGRLPWPTGTPLAYLLRFGVLVAVALVLAYVLERKLQPRVRAYFYPPATPVPQSGRHFESVQAG